MHHHVYQHLAEIKAANPCLITFYFLSRIISHIAIDINRCEIFPQEFNCYNVKTRNVQEGRRSKQLK